MDEHELIERITNRILGHLEAAERGILDHGDSEGAPCTTCNGDCECHRRRPLTTRRILDAGACRVAASYPAGQVSDAIAPCIDHTLLKPEATREQVENLCREAAKYTFASVCLNPAWVPLAADLLRGTGVAVCTVVGFPLGATTTDVKVFEAREAIAQGAREIDMVIHVGALKSKDFAAVERDIAAVARACGNAALLKVIIEAALLTDEEKVQACAIAKLAGADFVKTSTGFGPGGATLHDVELMRRTVGEDIGVKAAGGIRDRDTAEQMIRAGADRIGASASVQIVGGKKPA